MKVEAKNRSLVFHNVVDLYEIPLLIHAIEKDYRFAVRHHSRSLAETVLYCWIGEHEVEGFDRKELGIYGREDE